MTALVEAARRRSRTPGDRRAPVSAQGVGEVR